MFDPHTIAGCDVPVEAFDFEIVRYVSVAHFTTDYLHRLQFNSVGVNDAFVSVTVEGVTISFAEGELLYLGCTFSKRQPEGDWEVVLSFAASANIVGRVINSASGNFTVNKKGWHELWIRLAEKDITAGGKTYNTMQPIDAHEEQVIYTIDFHELDP